MNKWLHGFLAFLIGDSLAAAEEPAVLTLENVPYAKKIVADEPVRKTFSAKQAARYLDNASLNWQKNRKCATCHTNMPYLMARPALSAAMKDSGEVRGLFGLARRARAEWAKQTRARRGLRAV